MKALYLALFALLLAGCVSTAPRHIIASETTIRVVCDPNGQNCKESYEEVVVTAQPSAATNEQGLPPSASTTIFFYGYGSYVYPPVYAPTGSCCQNFGKGGKWWRW